MPPWYVVIRFHNCQTASKHCVTVTHTAGWPDQAALLFAGLSHSPTFISLISRLTSREAHCHITPESPTGSVFVWKTAVRLQFAHLLTSSVSFNLIISGCVLRLDVFLLLVISKWHAELLQLPSCFIFANGFELLNCFNFSLNLKRRWICGSSAMFFYFSVCGL